MKKKKKVAAKGKLSFGLDEDEGGDGESPAITSRSATNTPRSNTPLDIAEDSGQLTPRLGPNASVGFAPKILTKASMAREAETREKLKKEFLAIQRLVKATEFVLPFVFYDGTNVPGGICRMKKGDPVWLFLDKSRKVGAELGTGTDKSRREWARVGVDDLMLVRNEIIIPHVRTHAGLDILRPTANSLQHYEFNHFISNKTRGFSGQLFPYSAQPTEHSPTAAQLEQESQAEYEPLSIPGAKKPEKANKVADELLEGFNDEPTFTKVVDRRWYDRNKHIFPASVWEAFDPTKDYTTAVRKDTQGNAFFLGL